MYVLYILYVYVQETDFYSWNLGHWARDPKPFPSPSLQPSQPPSTLRTRWIPAGSPWNLQAFSLSQQ